MLDDLPRVLSDTGQAALMLSVSADGLRQRIGQLKGRNVYFTVACRDRGEAQDILDLVRSESRTLVH